MVDQPALIKLPFAKRPSVQDGFTACCWGADANNDLRREGRYAVSAQDSKCNTSIRSYRGHLQAPFMHADTSSPDCTSMYAKTSLLRQHCQSEVKWPAKCCLSLHIAERQMNCCLTDINGQYWAYSQGIIVQIACSMNPTACVPHARLRHQLTNHAPMSSQ